MKKSIIITSFALVIAAGLFFVFGLFATPANAGLLDGNFDCFPLPVCPDDVPHPDLDCFPLPFCPDDHDDVQRAPVNCARYPNRCQPVSRSGYAEPAPTHTDTYNPIQISCYASNGTIRTGETTVWSASATGGNGSYSYSWRDSDGVTGSGPSFSRSYGTPATRTAQVTVSSAGMEASRDCGSVNVYKESTNNDNHNDNNDDRDYRDRTRATNTNTNTNRNTNNVYINGYPYSASASQYDMYYPQYQYQYQYPAYYYPQYQPQYFAPTPISVSCSADTTYTVVGNRVMWRAFVSGGSGNVTYSWTGTDGLAGYGNNVPKSYIYPGQKSARVTVYAGGQSASAYCPAITIDGQVAYAPAPQYPVAPAPVYPPAAPALDIACYASPTKIKTGQTSTWTADVSNAAGPYTYSWSGTDALVSNQKSVSKIYYTAGTKKATVTVRSADGRSTTRACGVTVSVTAPVTASSYGKEGSAVAKAPAQPAPQYQAPQYSNQVPQYYDPVTGQPLPPGVEPVLPNTDQPTSTQTANSFFSLKNVPWGWVSFLVILVLFATVIYLIFNKGKI
jgi:hypothetical protein